MEALRLDIETPHGGAFQLMLDPGEVDVGRSAACGVRLPYPVVSSRHLRLSHETGVWKVIDLGSKNGTLLDGRPIAPRQPTELTDGAQLQISDVKLTVSFSAAHSDGFTLTESGTMLRKLLAESAEAPDGAFLEASDGTRVDVPDFAADLRPSAEAAFAISRRGHGFWVHPTATLMLDGETVPDGGAALVDGAQLASENELTWTFHDPLETFVDALDEEIEPAAQPAAEPFPRPLDRVLLFVGIGAAVLSAAALLVVFDVL